MLISVCAYCEREHVLTILTPGVTAERALEALESGEASHGMCARHEVAAQAEVERWAKTLPGPMKTVLATVALIVTLAMPSAAAAPYRILSAEDWARLTPEQQTFYVVGAADAFQAIGLRCPGPGKSYGEQIHIMREQIRAILSRGKRMNLVSGAESLLANLRAQKCVIEEPAK